MHPSANALALPSLPSAIKALNGNRRQLPLAIMTSDDTHARTEALLRSHAFFGADPAQVTLVKQEKVACLADNDARLALTPGDAWAVQTKPHGHGDVHMLLHSSGLAARWRDAGLRWAVFFQDTNALVFRAIPAALGVSAARAFDFNSLAVPRRAKEAIGAITKLAYPDGTSRTLNVEYNQVGWGEERGGKEVDLHLCAYESGSRELQQITKHA